MPRRYAYVVPMRRRRVPLILAALAAVLALVVALELELGVLAAAAIAAVLGGLTYTLANRE